METLPSTATILHDVSCTIIAFNEADRIGRCIESVRGLVREVVVIDSGSTDSTREVAAALGARVIFNKWPGYGPQKRFAEDAARHDWILNLDADEWLTDDARAELTSVLSKPIPEQIHGFRLKIKTVYPGAAAPRIFADAHHYVRLYNRTKCRFPTALVHDEIKLPRANRGQISAPVYHHSIRSLAHLIEKNKAYYQLQTQEIRKSRLGVSVRIVFEPAIVFLKYYFLKRHFTGGVYGLLVASTVAYLKSYRLAVIAFGTKTPERKNP